ncbi:MAG: hypothetical protein U9O96_02160 [Candidatus Thermoplasmatota archaeon]|nr:hypothetical protein [Candidatus Thermoplasmatota archaeon]
MELYEVMGNRWSTLHFHRTSFPMEKLDKILEVGLLSPSGADKKPYICIIVDEVDLKR